MTLHRRHLTQWLLGSSLPAVSPLLQAATATAAETTDYPKGPVKLIVPGSPGSSVDAMARNIGQRLGKRLKQQVIVDYKPGANTMIGTDFVAKSPGDGHTLLFTINSIVLNPLLHSKVPYDIYRDFKPVSLTNYGILVYVVGADVPVNTMREYVAYARERPGKVDFATMGLGSSSHLYGEKLGRDAQISLNHVPYKSGAQIMQDVLGGQVMGGFLTLGETLQHYKAGKVKLLGVFGTKRLPFAPDVPTFKEQGFNGYEMGGFWGVFAPSATPAPIVARLSREIGQCLQEQDLRDFMTGLGFTVGSGTAEELLSAMRRETLVWARLIKDLNLRLS